MKKIKFLLAFLLVLMGCTRSSEKNNYLSILTTVVDINNHLQMINYCYDIETEKITKVSQLEYNAQYPLSVYSKEDNKVYYTSNIDNGDQLFSLNLKTKETKQLTENVFAINYIIPTKDKIYLLLVMKNERSLKPAIYDKKSNKLKVYNKKDDLNFEVITYDNYNQYFYASASKQKDIDQALEKANSGKGQKYIAPNYYIYDLSEDINKPKKIYTTENKLIRRMFSHPDGSLSFTQAESIPEWNPQYYSYSLDSKKDQLESITNIDELMYISEFVAYHPNGEEIFFLGSDSDNEKNQDRCLYLYNFKTKEIKLIFEVETGFINSFVMISE